MKKSICIPALAVLLACPAGASARGDPGGGEGGTGGAPAIDTFTFGITLGMAYAFDYYTGGHLGIDLGFRIGSNAHLVVAPAFSGGHDIERDMGVFNWTATVGYRHFVSWEASYATVLLGPTAGYWINDDNGEWLTIGGTLQTALMWRGAVDYGLFVGLTLVGNFAQNDDVEDQFDGRIQVGGKLNF
jgi:hypothetical protein